MTIQSDKGGNKGKEKNGKGSGGREKGIQKGKEVFKGRWGLQLGKMLTTSFGEGTKRNKSGNPVKEGTVVLRR